MSQGGEWPMTHMVVEPGWWASVAVPRQAGAREGARAAATWTALLARFGLSGPPTPLLECAAPAEGER